jgi:hypothetical protein
MSTSTLTSIARSAARSNGRFGKTLPVLRVVATSIVGADAATAGVGSDLPRRAAFGVALEMGIELGGLQAIDAQWPTAPHAPKVAVVQAEIDIVGAQQVGRLAPGRRSDLELRRMQAQAANEADVEGVAAGQLHAAAERVGEQALQRRGEEGPAGELTDRPRAGQQQNRHAAWRQRGPTVTRRGADSVMLVRLS